MNHWPKCFTNYFVRLETGCDKLEVEVVEEDAFPVGKVKLHDPRLTHLKYILIDILKCTIRIPMALSQLGTISKIPRNINVGV
jgi:hypothetical protein